MVTAHKGVGEPRQDAGPQRHELMDALDIQAEATARAEVEDIRAVFQETAQVQRTAAGPHMDSRLGRAAKCRREARADARRKSDKSQGEGEAADQDDQNDEYQTAAALPQESEGYGTDREQDTDRDVRGPPGAKKQARESPTSPTWAGFLRLTLGCFVRLPIPARQGRRARTWTTPTRAPVCARTSTRVRRPLW